MARLIDRLADAEFLPPPWLRPKAVDRIHEILPSMEKGQLPDMPKSEIRQIVKEAVAWRDEGGRGFRDAIFKTVARDQVIVADNVAELCLANFVKSDGNLEVADCPNAAPPFKRFWIEAKFPAVMTLAFADGDKESKRPFLSAGMQCDALTPDQVVKDGLGKDAGHLEYIAKNKPDARWIINALMMIETTKSRVMPVAMCGIAVAEDGRVLGMAFGRGGDEVEDETDRGLIHLVLGILFAAVAFMHCKNVKIQPNDPPAALNKKRLKRGHKPLVRFHTLQIEPMTRILQTEGRAGTSGIKQALHICRGHFKKFDDKPLFGRHRGLYWWDQQVRGRSKEGVVVKDYGQKPTGTPPLKDEPSPERVWAGAKTLTDDEPERPNEAEQDAAASV